MKNKHFALLILTATTVATTALLTGCKSPGYDQGNKTAANIQASAARISALSGQIDTTLAALNDIVAKPAADLRPQYKQFASSLGELESAAREIASARGGMGDEGKAFFAKWDEQIAQIQNEDIKARSQSRKDEVSKQLLAIKTSYAEAAAAFKPFLADLKDVQKYLSVDLTASGVAAIKEPAAAAMQNAVPLKASILKVADDFKTLGVSMSSLAPPPQPAP